MRITGSCGIRLACPSCLLGAVVSVLRTMRAVLVPPLVPSGGSPLAPACLMFAAVCLDASPPSSHHLVLGCVPLSACLGSCLSSASPRHRYLSRCRYHPIASRRPPRLIDTTGGAIRRPRGGSRLLLARHRFAISSVRFGIGWRRGFSACLVRLLMPVPVVIIGAACYPLARPIRFPRRPAALPPHRLPPRSLDTGSWSRLLVFAVLFRLLSICVGSVYCGGEGCLACLNGVYLFLSMGDVVARRCVSDL